MQIRIERLRQVFTVRAPEAFRTARPGDFACDSKTRSLSAATDSEDSRFVTVFHEIETAILNFTVEVERHLLTVASSIRRIYDNSLDIADLVMPKPS